MCWSWWTIPNMCICDTFPGIWLIFILLPQILLPEEWTPLSHQEHRAHCLSSTRLQLEIHQIHGMLAQPGLQQISSCLVSPGTDSLSYWWHCLVACGMLQFGSCLGRLQQQVAVVILTHYSSAVSATDGGEPAGAEGTGTLTWLCRSKLPAAALLASASLGCSCAALPQTKGYSFCWCKTFVWWWMNPA